MAGGGQLEDEFPLGGRGSLSVAILVGERVSQRKPTKNERVDGSSCFHLFKNVSVDGEWELTGIHSKIPTQIESVGIGTRTI